MVLGRYLEQRWEGGSVRLDPMPYPLGNLHTLALLLFQSVCLCWIAYVLVDEQDGNVLALRGEALEGGLDVARLRLGVDDEEVLL